MSRVKKGAPISPEEVVARMARAVKGGGSFGMSAAVRRGIREMEEAEKAKKAKKAKKKGPRA